MEFKETKPSGDYVTKEWRAGRYRVVQLFYAFAQKRVQVWYDLDGCEFPDVLYTQF